MKKSFILHSDTLSILDKLTDEQAGKLLRAIHEYNTSGKEPDDQVIALVFHPFKAQFDRDMEKYGAVCERNRQNGKKGGRKKPTENEEDKEGESNPNKSKKTQSVILEPTVTQGNPKNLDSDSDSDSDSDISNLTTIPVSPEKEFSEDSQKFADWYLNELAPESIKKSMTASIRKKWMDTYDFLIRHKYTKDQIVGAVRWARADEFWQQNFMSPAKLKDKNKDGARYIDVFIEKMGRPLKPGAEPVSEFDRKYPPESPHPLPGYVYAPGTGKYHRPAKYNPAKYQPA